MEIRDWIRAIGARMALIAVVAVVAGVLAATLALFQPQQYRATATVALPDVPTFGPLTSAVGQRVANFQGAVTSDGVLDAVAQKSGAPRTSLDTVTSVRSGTSNVMEVRFVGTDEDQARDVVIHASREALLLQAQTDAAYALAVADANEEAYNAAYDAFRDLVSTTGIAAPVSTLARLENDYRKAETDLLQAENDGDDDAIADANTKLESLQVELGEAQQVLEADTNVDSALTTWTAAQERLRQAEGQVRAAENADVRVGGVVQLSKLSAMIKQGAYAALFGAALAVGFVIIVELLRSGTGSSRPSLPRTTRQRTRAGAF